MYISTLSARNPETVPLTFEGAVASLSELGRTFQATKLQSTEKTQRCLQALAELIKNNADIFSELMCAEGHRPISACRAEALRAAQTVEKTLEAMRRLEKVQSFDFSDAAAGSHSAISWRFTYGSVFAIVPFNFPLNLAMHKLAPALALGIPIVVKAPLTHPTLYREFHRVLLEAGFADDSFAFLLCENEEIQRLLDAVTYPIISFTGSAAVGLSLRRRYSERKVILELGGTATIIVGAKLDAAAADRAADGIARSAFGAGGQSCISAQHLFVPESEASSYTELIKKHSAALATSTPLRENATALGPLINAGAFQKASDILKKAKDAGHDVWCSAEPIPGENLLPPTVVFTKDLFEFPPDFLTTEVFSPILMVHFYPDSMPLPELCTRINRLDSNIHASVFSASRNFAEEVYSGLAARTVLWNEIPSWRADAMPYGGSLLNRWNGMGMSSGLVGDEGPERTLCDYTVDRLFVLP